MERSGCSGSPLGQCGPSAERDFDQGMNAAQTYGGSFNAVRTARAGRRTRLYRTENRIETTPS